MQSEGAGDVHDRYDDEVARRREARRRQKAAQEDNGEQRGEDEEDEIPRLSWSDTFAMIIAAYQVLFPMVLAMAGVMLLGYFIFRWVFS